jgi:hypothetical protein
MLKKLSLAALVAMGSMSVASATDLSSAIKGVNLTGYLRLRAYHENSQAHAYNRWRTTAAFNFAVPVSDVLKFHSDFAFNWSVYSNTDTGAAKNTDNLTSGSNTPQNTHLYVDYAANGANVILGRIPVATPVTGSGVGEAYGSGAIATYKVGAVTLAAAGIDNLLNTSTDSYLGTLSNVGINGNVYAAAAIFGSDMADAQLWYFHVTNKINSDFVFRTDIKALKDQGVTFHLDYARASLVDSISKDTQTYYNVATNVKVASVTAKVGYAKTGKDGGIVSLDADAPISAVLPAEQTYSITGSKDTSAYYLKVGTKIDAKTGVWAGYTHIKDKSEATAGKSNEYVAAVEYSYTKKFHVQAYYSIYDEDGTADDNNEARLELKYKF